MRLVVYNNGKSFDSLAEAIRARGIEYREIVRHGKGTCVVIEVAKEKFATCKDALGKEWTMEEDMLGEVYNITLNPGESVEDLRKLLDDPRKLAQPRRGARWTLHDATWAEVDAVRAAGFQIYRPTPPARFNEPTEIAPTSSS